jgi:hypothetical protein
VTEALTDGDVPASPTEVEAAEGTRLVQPVRRDDGTAVIEVLVPAGQLRGRDLHLGGPLGLGIVLLLRGRRLPRPPEVRDVATAVNRLAGRIDEVISEARRSVREGLGTGCDASAVVGERVQFWSVPAEEEARAVTVELPGVPLPVRVAAADLGAAVDALLGNLFSHTPDGTPLRVAVRPGTPVAPR